jgi:tetratricopeptide (TPR) repeat protein
MARAIALARQALDAGRDDPETMWQAAHTLFYLAGETDLAAAVLDHALEINPNSAEAWTGRGWFHVMRNQSEPALAAFDRALRLNPFDPLGFLNAAGFAAAHFNAQRFEQAIEWANCALRDQPRFIGGLRIKVAALGHLGRAGEARAELARLMAIYPGLTIAAHRAAYASCAAPELIEFFAAGLRLAGLPER